EPYKELYDFVSNNSLEDKDSYAQVAEQIDIDNFIIYFVAQTYFNNIDWPANNMKYWQTDGGKWRWILFDTDFGFGPWDINGHLINAIDLALEDNGPNWPNPPWSTLMFRKLAENNEFRQAFINRYADELNSRFLPQNVGRHIDAISNNVSAEIKRHYERWGGDYSLWPNALDIIKRFANLRPEEAKQHLLKTFKLADFHTVNIKLNSVQEGFVRINNRLTVEQTDWQGDYFQGVPFELEAIPRLGYIFSHWETSQGKKGDALISIDPKAPLEFKPIFISDPAAELPIVINEINFRSSNDFDTGDWIELHNPNHFAIDISGWIIKDDDDSRGFTVPAGTIMQAQSYWVVSRYKDRFSFFYPDMQNVIGDFGFGLSAKGDAVRIYDSNQIIQDEVVYSSDLDWPLKDADQGSTLQLKSPDFENSLAENWIVSEMYGSPGDANLVQPQD
ncbi:MAG: CotH kinase family protein, partial [Pseudomonadota bacterium]